MLVKSVCEIKDATVETMSGTSRAGQPYEIKRQYGFVRVGDEIRKFPIPVNGEAYPVGRYEVTIPVGFNQYGRPILLDRQTKLTAVK